MKNQLLNLKILKFSNIAENTSDILLNNSCDLDINFFNVDFQNLDTPYLLPEKSHDFLDNSSPNYFSILHLHLNINRIRKTWKLFLNSINFTFGVICFSEICLDDLKLSGNASHQLPDYTSKHEGRGDCKGGGVSICSSNSLNFKSGLDLTISNNDIESLSAEIVSGKVRNTIAVLYRPPNGQIEPFETFLNNTFSQIKVSRKLFILLAILI